jgi:elongator complex protein 1
MQQHLVHFEAELKDSLDEIWSKPQEVPLMDSWALRMAEAEKDRNVNVVDKIPKPDIPSSTWKVTLFEHGLLY